VLQRLALHYKSLNRLSGRMNRMLRLGIVQLFVSTRLRVVGYRLLHFAVKDEIV
jgi:hypothetical protein